MSVLISNDAELDTLLDAQEVEHICEVVLAAEGVEREVEISLSYVDEDEMHELNHEWRGIDRTTVSSRLNATRPLTRIFPPTRRLSLAISSWPRKSLPVRPPALAMLLLTSAA